VSWLFSQSTNSSTWMGVFHLLFWGVATIFGLRFLHSGFSQTHARSTAGFNIWAVIFVLVMLQMTTALRPLIEPAPSFLPKEKRFFLSYWADCLNANAKETRDSGQ